MNAPLIAHVIYRLDFGGLENGLVNLINGLPAERYRHAVIALTDATEFRYRIERSDVQVVTLAKPPGIRPSLYVNLWRLFRRLRPAIVHSRNLAALEAQLPAGLAGVPVRVHGEHGWDVEDLHGTDWKRRWIRRRMRPWVHQYVALSRHLEGYLKEHIRVPSRRIAQIYNGVDVARFHPAEPETVREPMGPDSPTPFVVGTVGRLQEVKDQRTLVSAVALLLRRRPELRQRLRLVIIGDGPQGEELRAQIETEALGDHVWLAGSRDDVPALLQGMDLFVLPSLAEGICNTILEAMACGRPVVATAVGGNPELVSAGETGDLVPPGAPRELADAIEQYVDDPERVRRQGGAARLRAEREFSLGTMVARYQGLYDGLLARAGIPYPETAPETGPGASASGEHESGAFATSTGRLRARGR